MTSAPVCAASAAVTELSTPPDMATTILACLGGVKKSKLTGICGVFTRISLLRARESSTKVTKGTVLARHEPDIRASKETQLSLSELLSLLGEQKEGSERERQDAIACYLSASEGWAEAVRRLGGAFAREATELRERKAD